MGYWALFSIKLISSLSYAEDKIHLHFIGETSEVQRSQATYPRLQSRHVAELDCEPERCDLQVHMLSFLSLLPPRGQSPHKNVPASVCIKSALAAHGQMLYQHVPWSHSSLIKNLD